MLHLAVRPRRSRCAALAFVFAALAAAELRAQESPRRQWELLFDGESLKGWKQRGGEARYEIESGAIVGSSVPNTPNSFLCTERLFGDFALELEFQVDGELNSGIQIRSEARPDGQREKVFGYQVEIDPSPRAWTAGIYDESRRGWLNPLDRPEQAGARGAFRPGEWNHLRVHAEGASIRTWLNGVPCADLLDAQTLRGFIALQVHGVGKREEPLRVRWREIRVQDLGAHVWRASSAEELAASRSHEAIARLRFRSPSSACAIAWRGRLLRLDPTGTAGLAPATTNELVLHARGERIAAQLNGKAVAELAAAPSDAPRFALLDAERAGLRLEKLELLVRDPQAVPRLRYAPKIESESADLAKLAAGFELGAGLSAALFAAEPALANPVALALDAHGAVYVAETFRQDTKGVPDNRSHEEWVDDDLRARTLEDRTSYFLSHHPRYRSEWREQHDRIRKLVDRDGDGRAETTTVFAEGFNDLLDGTGAGLLVDGESVWYTCIPYLWQLLDRDGDGVAEAYEPLHRGYGVRVALRGHDLHGLCFGPDGRLYFSVGDRGYELRTAEGKRFSDPGSGAVFRCEPDGSQLELFATGLRNPQELAFNAWGDLFTGDNNCDAGDSARLVHVVEGSETGWRMSYQYRDDRGPWMPEGIWQLRHEGQPAYVLPPLAYVGAGPSGIAFEPGTALDEAWRGKLLLCDFRGSAANSGVLALTLEREGASYRLAKQEKLIHGVLTTDADFGPDGALYVADWVAGWVGEARGRIWRVHATNADPRAAETLAKLRAPLAPLDARALTAWLADPDQRVRQRAQFELARRGSAEELASVAGDANAARLARVHAAWALGQLARRDVRELAVLERWLEDADEELRAQAARVLGEAAHAPAFARLVALLSDADPRVAAHAALALRKLGNSEAVPELVELLRRNADRDLVVRHAASHALAGLASAPRLSALAGDAATSVRLGAVLALRTQRAPEVAAFLGDAEDAVSAEAARAIYDRELRATFPALRDLLERAKLESAHARAGLRRAIAALEIEGDPAAPLLARLAARADAPAASRAEALRVLETWGELPPFESVHHTPALFGPRAKSSARDALAPLGAVLLASGVPDEVRAAAARALAAHELGDARAALLALARDEAADAGARRAALGALERLRAPELRAALESAWAARDERLRGEADEILSRLEPEQALEVLRSRLEQGSSREQQRALATLAGMQRADADALLAPRIALLANGSAPKELLLDLCEAAEKRREVEAFASALEAHRARQPAADPLAAYAECEDGGDERAGREVFRHKTAVGCTRCHAVGDQQPVDATVLAGPDLSAVGVRLDRRAILESIVEPNRALAAGFEMLYVESVEGEVWRGRVVREDEQTLVLVAPVRGVVQEVAVPKADIDRRQPDISGMPTGLAGSLSKRELRDLVAYLASCRTERNTAPAKGTSDR
ncbi:MAG: DUF1080 domain-containing protein [Planctomycetes bacterium]|nr:DUF1080 domain-containing protein [Planctomycetota bacterium]